MDTFEQFLNDFVGDKLEPYLKSEAVPDNSNNAVKVSNYHVFYVGMLTPLVLGLSAPVFCHSCFPC